jgi:arylsulfatase A-like enzyme
MISEKDYIFYLKHIFTLFSLLIILSGCVKKTPPNIIFLLTDDQRWDAIGCSGNEIIQTPNMDILAKHGVYFPNAYVTTPICAISRASIFSGQYARRHGILDFKTHFTDSAFDQTYPILLKKAGYSIGFIGKYGIGEKGSYSTNHWDYWKGFPDQGKYWHKDSLGNDVHLTRLIGQWAQEFLDQSVKGQPFCLSVSFKAPHVQDTDPRQFLYDSVYSDLYKDTVFPLPVTGDSSFWYSYPEFFRKDNEARRRWGIRFSTPEKYQTSMRGYYRLIYGVDVVIGEIREKLKEKGMDKNTIIMLMGDNGFYLGEHGMAGKWYEHEESIRVPLIIFNPLEPELNKGLKITNMVLNVDIAPTILNFAGVEVPPTMQGESLKMLIEHPDISWRNDFLFEHLFEFYRLPRSEGVVSEHMKYVHFLDREPGYEWLFDLKNDSLEVENLADDSLYLTEKNKLINRLEYFKGECL